MNRIDVLPGQERRFDGITGDVLADARDAGLQALTTRALAVTGAPMAGVSLVLHTIQYFRADDGLPGDLARVRAVARHTGFCQYVVRDEAPVQIADVEQAAGVPKDLLHRYGIRAYCGHPVRLDGRVIGAMCVFDTVPRRFDAEACDGLRVIAAQAEARLASLAERGVQTPQPIRAALEPAVAAIERRLRPLRPSITEARVAALELEVLNRALSGGDISPSMIDDLSPALSAVGVLHARLGRLEAATEAALRGVELLREVAGPSHVAVRLVDLVDGADAIARALTSQMGGVRWRLPLAEYSVPMARPMAMALLSTALTTVAGIVRRRTVEGELWVEISAVGGELHIDIGSPRLRYRDGEAVQSALRHLGLDNTRGRLVLTGNSVQLILPTVRMQ